ncbi:MAG: sulfurtransferase TusA family protein [Desulfobacteraceae bacterium]|nr:MAG: sulfurtransferase TusA family protein [Desulfobacteraceae bacterium]
MAKKEIIDLNIFGQVCPACLLVALKQVNILRDKLKKGETELLIRTDHRDATRTIPESVRAMGYEVEVRKVTSHYEIRVGNRL